MAKRTRNNLDEEENGPIFHYVKSELSDYKYLVYKEENGVLHFDHMEYHADMDVSTLLKCQVIFKDGTYGVVLDQLFKGNGIERSLVKEVLSYLAIFYGNCGW